MSKLKKYRVHIVSGDSGYFEIAAGSEDEAREMAEKRLIDGDTSWMHRTASGYCETEEIELI